MSIPESLKKSTLLSLVINFLPCLKYLYLWHPEEFHNDEGFLDIHQEIFRFMRIGLADGQDFTQNESE
jgi:hypothetical protein